MQLPSSANSHGTEATEVPKSRHSTSVWVHLPLEKFLLGRPLQRTIEQLGLYELDPAAGTMTAGMQRIEPLLKPIYQALRDRDLRSAVLSRG